MAMSEPGTETNFPASRRGKAWWLFAAIGAGCGGLAFAVFCAAGADTDGPRIALTAALIGVLAGTITGLIMRASTMRGLSLPRRMATWGAMGGWIVVVLIFLLCFVTGRSGPGIPYRYQPGFEGFWDRLTDAVQFPLFYGVMSGFLTAIGATIGAVAAVVWRLLCAAIRRIG